MKKTKLMLVLLLGVMIAAVSAQAQAATRPVVLNFTASTSSSVTGYAVFRCTVVSPATTCTADVTGTPIGSVTQTPFVDNPTVLAAYGYSLVAVSPKCTPTTPVTTPCGNSAPATVTVPVPPPPASGTAVIVVVP